MQTREKRSHSLRKKVRNISEFQCCHIMLRVSDLPFECVNISKMQFFSPLWNDCDLVQWKSRGRNFWTNFLFARYILLPWFCVCKKFSCFFVCLEFEWNNRTRRRRILTKNGCFSCSWKQFSFLLTRREIKIIGSYMHMKNSCSFSSRPCWFFTTKFSHFCLFNINKLDVLIACFIFSSVRKNWRLQNEEFFSWHISWAVKSKLTSPHSFKISVNVVNSLFFPSTLT